MSSSLGKNIFGVASILLGLYLFALEMREFIIVEFLSPNIFYLYVTPLMTRLTHLAFYLVMALSGYYLILGRKRSWYLYQMAAISLITERLFSYLLFPMLPIWDITVNFIFPITIGLGLFLFTNLEMVTRPHVIKIKTRIWWWRAVSIMSLLILLVLPKLDNTFDLIDLIFLTVLGAMLYFKMKLHWKYFAQIHYGNANYNIGIYLEDLIMNEEPFYQSFGKSLKFFAPFFYTEVMDRERDQYVKDKKRIKEVVNTWWLLAILFFIYKLVAIGYIQ